MNDSLFTVFTPTYNRAHTLDRVYESLLSQTCKNFEWLIVDDGSQDETRGKVESYIAEAKISIQYIWQPNRGKHTAFNRAIGEARGYFFLPLDSDDACIPSALERLHANWLLIPDNVRSQFSGITCLSRGVSGNIIGGVLPFEIIDGLPYEITSRYKLKGDKWGFHRTNILREYPFPEFPNEIFIAEGLVWNRIGRKYKVRFINECLHIANYQNDGLSSYSIQNRLSSPCSTFLYYSEAVSLPIRLRHRFRAAANLWRFAIQSNKAADVLSLKKDRYLIALSFFLGLLLALRDFYHRRNGLMK